MANFGGFWARLKTIAGFSPPVSIAVPTGSNNIILSEQSNRFYVTGVSGSPVVSTINQNSASLGTFEIMPGRIVTFEGAATVGTDVVFTNNAASTTAGQMDLGAADVTLSSTDVLKLKQRTDGVWVKQFFTDN